MVQQLTNILLPTVSEFRIASGLNGDVWICGNNGKIYKQFSE
jgi:exosome complex RNA-binding protein Rrp4